VTAFKFISLRHLKHTGTKLRRLCIKIEHCPPFRLPISLPSHTLHNASELKAAPTTKQNAVVVVTTSTHHAQLHVATVDDASLQNPSEMMTQ
jgi:hypothetical protein